MTDTPIESLTDEHLLDKIENDRKILAYIEIAEWGVIGAYDSSKALDPKKKDIGDCLGKLRETETELKRRIWAIKREIDRRMKQ